MGSRSKNDLAYIAGFLDGDGSLMLQLKKRSDGNSHIRFVPTICFYQDSRHDGPLKWIKDVLGIGYISKRNDGMTELRINGYGQVRKIISDLSPYIKFKAIQAKHLLDALTILQSKTFSKLDKADLNKLVQIMFGIQKENYVTKRKRTKTELRKVLGLTP